MKMHKSKCIITAVVLITFASSILPTLAEPIHVPIKNARVEARGNEGEGLGETGTDGTFQMREALAQGTYTVTITSEGYLTRELSDIDVEANSVTDIGDIYLNASATIRGQVVDPDGNAIGPSSVWLEKDGEIVAEVVSDDRGNFAFNTDIRTGTYAVSSTLALEAMQVPRKGLAPGTTSGVVAMEGSVTDGVIVRLSASGIISGKVTDKQSNPAKNVSVFAFNIQQGRIEGAYFGVTNDDGEYRIEDNLGSGRYNVTVFFPAGYVWGLNDFIQVGVQAGQETGNVDFQLEKSGSISGQVIYDDGSPARNTTVSAFSSDFEYINTARTDEDGNFFINTNLGAGDYIVSAFIEDAFSMPQNVQLETGDEVSGVLIILEGAGVASATVTGVVTDDKSKPLEDAVVSTTSGTSSISSESTDGDGRYSLVVYLPAGQTSSDIVLTASKKAYEGAENTVHVGSEGTFTSNFQLAPKPWGTIKGRVMGIVTKNPTTLSIVLSSSVVQIGTSVTISGYLNPARTGRVSIYTAFEGSAFAKVADVDLSDGQYSYSLTPDGIGTYDIQADWPGDDDYAAATSSRVTLTVTKITPTVSLSLSSTSVKVGDSVTASGTVTPFSGETDVTLTVTGPDGTDQATVTSTDGTYSYAFTGDSEGAYTVQASIPASANYNAAQSSAVSLTVEKKCVIATATFGSELSPEVNFLRQFRNDLILKTYAGSKFYIAFDAFYYSWSTPVAVFVGRQEGVRAFTKLVLYPLIGILRLTAGAVMPWFVWAPDAAAIVAGFIASFMIGIVYFFPPALAIRFALRRIRPMKPMSREYLRYNALFVLLTIPAMAIGIMANGSLFTIITTSLYVLATISLSISTGLYAVERKSFFK